MTPQEFETHIKNEISPDLYMEDTQLADRKRVMLNYPGINKPVFVCATPSGMIKDAPDPTYLDMDERRYPSRPEIENKIRNFITKLPENLDLYED